RCSPADVRGTRADGIERIIEIGPPKHAARGRVGAERPRLGTPARQWRLGLEDFLGRHSLEPVVTGVERADMVQAEPAPLARAVGARGPCARRAEFAGLTAPWCVTITGGVIISSMEFVR